MKKYFILSIFLLGCATKPVVPKLNKEVLTLQVYQHPYSLIMEEEASGEIRVSSSIIEEPSAIKVSANKNEPKLLEGDRDPEGRLLHHANYPEVTFTKLMIVPYYSLIGYNILTRVKNFDGGIYAPDCPIETKYLVIFQINNGPLPLFGCAL